jgi:hypothetical protein
METARFVVFRYSGVANHTSETSFVVTFIRVALYQPEKTH